MIQTGTEHMEPEHNEKGTWLKVLRLWLGCHWESLLLLGIYVIAYGAYHFAVEIPFDAGPLSYYMQYLDPWLLRHDLLRSLWYLHAQPPLMDFITGIAFKLGESRPQILLEPLQVGLGAVDILLIGRTLALLGVRRCLRVGIVLWLCVYPTFIMYVNWVYTPHMEFSMCCLFFYALVRLMGAEQLTFRAGVLTFFPCMCLALIRPQWSLPLFVGLLLMVLWFYRRVPGKELFFWGSSTALFPVFLWHLKNLLVFGFFGASSWGGMNLAQVTVFTLPPWELAQLQQAGEVSAWFPVSFNMNKAEQVREMWKQQGRPVVELTHDSLERKKRNGNENHNYLPFIEASSEDMEDSLAIIKHEPMAYINEVLARMNHVLHLPTSFGNMVPAGMYAIQQPLLPFKEDLSKGAVLLYGVCPLLTLLLAFWPPGGLIARQRPMIIMGIATALYIAVTSSAFTYGGESERMRWSVVPFYMVCFALLVEQALQTIRNYTERKKTNKET